MTEFTRCNISYAQPRQAMDARRRQLATWLAGVAMGSSLIFLVHSLGKTGSIGLTCYAITCLAASICLSARALRAGGKPVANV